VSKLCEETAHVDVIEWQQRDGAVVCGSMVKVTAVVRGEENGPIPTGRVNFLYGWSSFEMEHLANGSVTIDAKLPDNKNLPLRAIYVGDGHYSSAGSFDESQSHSCSRS
jgi:hypothetical protein